ncbi:MAG: RDD family protein [Pyrinomonadaceae bacterium]
MKYASFGARFLAFIVDDALLAIAASIFLALISALGLLGANNPNNPLLVVGAWLSSLVIMAFSVLFQFLYFGYFLSKDGQSIGKKLLGIRVQKREGGNVSFLVGGLRGSIGYYISGFIFFLGYIWAFFDKNHEAWHDKLFGTTVVQA